MVQRKDVMRGSSGTNSGKSRDEDERRKEKGEAKKKYKKLTSIKIADMEGGYVQLQHPPPSACSKQRRPPASRDSSFLPNYMKATGSSDAKKSSSGNRSRCSIDVKSSSGRKSVKRLFFSSNLYVSRATCSSTLKDIEFPKLLDLNPGGTEADGTSVLRVCPYTYCSLNGHMHNQLVPPLKSFLASRRKALKSHKSEMLAGKKGPLRGGNEDQAAVGMFTREKVASLMEVTADEFFVEIYAAPVDVPEERSIEDGTDDHDGQSSDIEECSGDEEEGDECKSDERVQIYEDFRHENDVGQVGSDVSTYDMEMITEFLDYFSCDQKSESGEENKERRFLETRERMHPDGVCEIVSPKAYEIDLFHNSMIELGHFSCDRLEQVTSAVASPEFVCVIEQCERPGLEHKEESEEQQVHCECSLYVEPVVVSDLVEVETTEEVAVGAAGEVLKESNDEEDRVVPEHPAISANEHKPNELVYGKKYSEGQENEDEVHGEAAHCVDPVEADDVTGDERREEANIGDAVKEKMQENDDEEDYAVPEEGVVEAYEQNLSYLLLEKAYVQVQEKDYGLPDDAAIAVRELKFDEYAQEDKKSEKRESKEDVVHIETSQHVDFGESVEMTGDERTDEASIRYAIEQKTPQGNDDKNCGVPEEAVLDATDQDFTGVREGDHGDQEKEEMEIHTGASFYVDSVNAGDIAGDGRMEEVDTGDGVEEKIGKGDGDETENNKPESIITARTYDYSKQTEEGNRKNSETTLESDSEKAAVSGVGQLCTAFSKMSLGGGEYIESDEEFRQKSRWLIIRRKVADAHEHMREFNPRPPNFLSLEPGPDAEKVDLRHQMMDDRKNAEEWMLDYALRRAVSKLAPARKKKVQLLVEAYETVLPLPNYEKYMQQDSGGSPQASPIQACS